MIAQSPQSLAGQGAQLPKLADSLSERLKAPCRFLNPFAGLPSRMPEEDMDAQSQLPSPWAAALGAIRTETFLLDADNNTANDVDGCNQKTGNRVTANKLRGTIHGTEEIRFSRDLFTPPAGIRFIDQPGVETWNGMTIDQQRRALVAHPGAGGQAHRNATVGAGLTAGHSQPLAQAPVISVPSKSA